MFEASVRGIFETKTWLADSGYQELYDYHKNSRIPQKRSQHHPLSKDEKWFNRALSSERVVIENMSARIKVFKRMSERYRNRRRRHGLRMNLVCAVLNLENNI